MLVMVALYPCPECGADLKAVQCMFGCRVNKHSIATKESIGGASGECDACGAIAPGPPAEPRWELNDDSKAKVAAARAKKGWGT